MAVTLVIVFMAMLGRSFAQAPVTYNCDDPARNPCLLGTTPPPSGQFPHDDPTQFIECQPRFECVTNNCPAKQIFDLSVSKCASTTGPTPAPPTPGGPCVNCFNGQCQEANLSAVYPNLFRTLDDLHDELPEDLQGGCRYNATEPSKARIPMDIDNLVQLTCVEPYQLAAKNSWSDGNCCCQAYQYWYCPKALYFKGQYWHVVHWGHGYQCWIQGYCSGVKGICQGPCVNRYITRSTLVYHPLTFQLIWVTHSVPLYCQCRQCSGAYCK